MGMWAGLVVATDSDGPTAKLAGPLLLVVERARERPTYPSAAPVVFRQSRRVFFNCGQDEHDDLRRNK